MELTITALGGDFLGAVDVVYGVTVIVLTFTFVVVAAGGVMDGVGAVRGPDAASIITDNQTKSSYILSATSGEILFSCPDLTSP